MRLWVTALAFLFAFGGPLRAHPHVFVEQRVTLLFEVAELKALLIEWTFDELYSASLVADFLDRQRTAPSAAQVRAVEQQAFASAEQANYFLILKVDDRLTKVGRHGDFAVDFDGPRVRYRFTVPVNVAKAQRLAVNALDDQWFIDFSPAKLDPVRFERTGNLDIHCGIATEPQKTVLGMVDMPIVTCRWSSKP